MMVFGIMWTAWLLKNPNSHVQKILPDSSQTLTPDDALAPLSDPSLYDAKPASLESWRKSLADNPVFRSVSGLNVTLEAGQVWLRIQADDLFESAVIPIHANYLPVLDQLAVRIQEKEKANQILHVTIHVHVKADDPQEFASTEFGKSRLTLATGRGEWIARYLERKHGITIQHFSVQGHAEPKRSREIGIQFSSSRSSSS